MKNKTSGQKLREIVLLARERLQAVDETKSARRPAPGKWSAKEVIGHLIDSASNNHQRFIRAQFQDHLIFPGYDQEAWVEIQDYQNREWIALIELWIQFNLHLAQVIDRVPDHIARHPHEEHNLDRIAWKTIPADETATLKYFMADYVGHLEHHLRQISPLLGLNF